MWIEETLMPNMILTLKFSKESFRDREREQNNYIKNKTTTLDKNKVPISKRLDLIS